MRINNTAHDGIFAFGNNNANGNGENNWFSKIYSSYNGHDGIFLDIDSPDTEISECYIFNNGQDGIVFQGWRY